MSKTVLFFFMISFFAGSQDIYLTYLCSCYLYLFLKKNVIVQKTFLIK